MTGFSLKMLALFTMILDHMGATFSYVANTHTLRLIGRIAFPIYAFLISEGCRHTKNFPKYLLRLFLFALISELPFNFLFKNIQNILFGKPFTPIMFGAHNVFFTLFLGALSVYVLELLKKHLKAPVYAVYMLSYIFAAFTAFFIAESLGSDYGAWGVMMIFFLYVAREEKRNISLSFMTPVFMSVIYYLSYSYSGEVWYFIILGAVFTLSYMGPELINLPKIEKYRAYLVMAFYINAIYNSFYSVNALFLAAISSILFIDRYNGRQGKKATLIFYAAYPLHIIILGAIWYFFIYPSM